NNNSEYYIDPNIVDVNGRTPLLAAIEYDNHQALEQLIQLTHVPDIGGHRLKLNHQMVKSPLHLVVRKRNFAALKLLLQAKVAPDANKQLDEYQIGINRFETNKTVLYFAIEERYRLQK